MSGILFWDTVYIGIYTKKLSVIAKQRNTKNTRIRTKNPWIWKVVLIKNNLVIVDALYNIPFLDQWQCLWCKPKLLDFLRLRSDDKKGNQYETFFRLQFECKT